MQQNSKTALKNTYIVWGKKTYLEVSSRYEREGRLREGLQTDDDYKVISEYPARL